MKKKFTSAIVALCLISSAHAQGYQCYSEDFSSEASGWTYSNGASITSYANPGNGCIINRGIITPGVGGNNPANIMTPAYVSSGGSLIAISFDMYVMDANLKCETWKDFNCRTSIDVFYYIGATKYRGIIDRLLPPNGPENSSTVNIRFNAGTNLPEGTAFKVELVFKPKSGLGQCVQQNTKYVFDNFTLCQISNDFEPSERGSNTTPLSSPQLDLRTNLDAVSQNVYPNPTNGLKKITVTGITRTDRILLVDNSGRLVQNVTTLNNGLIDVSRLNKGIYFIRIIKVNGQETTNKIVIN